MAKKKVKKSNSQKTIWVVLVVALIVFLGIFASKNKSMSPYSATTPTLATNPTSFDFANQKIMLNNQELHFINGSYANPDTTYGQHTATMTMSSVNPSGTRAAAILVDSPGGSGVFLYLIGSTLKDGKEIYSEPILLGDRIKVVSVSVDDPGAEDNGLITVQTLDRPASAPMATQPTIPVTANYAFQDDGNLIFVLH